MTATDFEIGTARVATVPGSPATRLSASRLYQNTSRSNVSLYMRAFFQTRAGTLAYRGVIIAKRIN
jgi:hypothetical protein